MNYEVEYQGKVPTSLRLEPDPVSSNGIHNRKLFNVAMSRFCPKGWHWNGEYLSTRLFLGDLPDSMVEQAQAKVTGIMDMLDEFRDFLYVVGEYERAQSNP